MRSKDGKAGERYNYWTLLEDRYIKTEGINKHVSYVKCQCDCGTVRVVRWFNIKTGHVKKCSVDCLAFINAEAAKMPEEKINTVDKWLEVFNNDMTFVPKPASEATHWPPGSVGKMDVMRRRLENGQALFHPDDERDCERHEDLFNIERDRV